MKFAIPIAAILAILRVYLGLTVAPETPELMDFYKTAAHLFMGGLAVLWWQDKLRWGLMFWGLNALEVLAAIFTRISV